MKFGLGIIVVLLLASGYARAELNLPSECLSKLKDETLYSANKLDGYRTLVPGEDGWLFRTKTDFIQDFKFKRNEIENLKILTKSLELRGTTLVITYQPTRGIMAADKVPLNSDFDAAIARDSYLQLIEQMRNQGIHMVGVPDFSLGEHYFKTTDHHWSSLGARKSAEAAADYIKTLPVYEKIPKMAFETSLIGEQPSKGSFTNVLKALCDIDVPPEKADLFATKPRAVASDADALFGDTQKPEIVLVGTSNSKMESSDSNFEGALKFYLGADVLNKAFAGAGFDEPLFSYLASDEFQKNPPKILIWEVPGYYSTLGSNRVMDQAIALSNGLCTSPQVSIKDKVIEGEDLILFEGLDFNSTEAYVWLQFDKKNIGSFHFQIIDDSGKDSSFKIRRGARYPADGIFGVVIRKRDFKNKIDTVQIKVPSHAEGTQVNVNLCPLPDEIYKLYKQSAQTKK